MIRLLIFIIIILSIINFHKAHRESEQQDLAAHWLENIIGDDLFPEKLSLFHERGFLTIDDGTTLQQLHQKQEISFDASLPYPFRNSNGSFVKDQLLPPRIYLGLLRIHYADEYELPQLWNSLIDLHSKKNCDSIVSFHNELKVLRLLHERMEELTSEGKKHLLIATADGSIGTAEFLVHLLGIFAKIAFNMVESTKLSGYYQLIRAISQPNNMKNLIENNPKITLRIFMNYFRQKIGDQLNKELDYAPYLPREPAVDTLHGLLYVYLQRSILPYMNTRWEKEERLHSSDVNICGTVLYKNHTYEWMNDKNIIKKRLLIIDHRDDINLRIIMKSSSINEDVMIDNDGDVIIPISNYSKEIIKTEFNYLKIRVMKTRRLMYNLPLEANSTNYTIGRYGIDDSNSMKSFICILVSPTANSARKSTNFSSDDSAGAIVPDQEKAPERKLKKSTSLWSKLFESSASSSTSQEEELVNVNMKTSEMEKEEYNLKQKHQINAETLEAKEFCFVNVSYAEAHIRTIVGPAMTVIADLLEPIRVVEESLQTINQVINTSTLREQLITERLLALMLDESSKVDMKDNLRLNIEATADDFTSPLTIGAGRSPVEDESVDLIYNDPIDTPLANKETLFGSLMLPQWTKPVKSYSELGFKSHNYTRLLSLGIGTAALHSIFLRSYPRLIVDSVDQSEDIARSAIDDYQMHRTVCRFLKMVKVSNDTMSTVRDYSFQSLQLNNLTSSMEKLLLATEEDVGINWTSDDSCRSTFIIANVSEYIESMGHAAQILDEQYFDTLSNVNNGREHHYDIVITEVSSSSETFKLTLHSIMMLKKLVSPAGGAVIFHIKSDVSFHRYLRVIADSFGMDQIVHLRSKSNSNILVAARNRFISSGRSIQNESEDSRVFSMNQSHPCNDGAKFVSSVRDFVTRSGFTGQLKYSHLFSLDCEHYKKEVLRSSS